MPRMDGLTLAREIKARADLPIIVLSAIDAGDNKADLLDEFAEDYITKPYHYSELRARIQRVLRRVGERVPRKGLDLGPDLILELHRRQAIVRGEAVAADPDRIAAPLRPRRQPRPDRHDGDPARPRLGGDRRRRAVLRLGHDAPPAPEARSRSQPAAPPADGPRHRLPAGGSAPTARRQAATRLSPDTADRPTRRDARPATVQPRTQPRLQLSFQTRLTLTLLAAAIVPLVVFGLLLIVSGAVDPEIGTRLLLFMFAVAVVVGILGGAAVGAGPRPAAARDLGRGLARVGRRHEPADPGRRHRRPRPARREPQPPGRRRRASQPPARD